MIDTIPWDALMTALASTTAAIMVGAALSRPCCPGLPVSVPLYARLSNAEQNKVFQPTRRHIVLATNVAETSLTASRRNKLQVLRMGADNGALMQQGPLAELALRWQYPSTHWLIASCACSSREIRTTPWRQVENFA